MALIRMLLWFIYSAIKAMLVCVHSWCDSIVILRSISSTCVVRVGRFVDRCRGVVVVQSSNNDMAECTI